MRNLTVFNNISLDGYFTDKNNDISWAHTNDPEWMEFTSQNAKGESELLFGRITYDMMASFWPTPQAKEMLPDVAKAMNKMTKYVFSKSKDKLDWENSKLMKGDLVAEVKKLKAQDGPGIMIFGSGTIIAQLTDAGLIDEYQIVVHPLVLGKGRTMFDGIKNNLKLKRTNSREFKNGNLMAWYQLSK
jgi:dihydrofolate reductase